MKDYVIRGLFFAGAILLTGCGRNIEFDKSATVDQTIETVLEIESDDSKVEALEERDDSTGYSDNVADNDSPQTPSDLVGMEYDRAYLEENGRYIYRVTDKSVIEQYDELYFEAFVDTISSYKNVMEWRNQGYNSEYNNKTSNLLYKQSGKREVITVGSYYEMDYNFDLNNVGYTYVDLDSDGVFELIFGVLDDADVDWIPNDYFERAYAFANGKVVKFCEGGSRDLYWLGRDGHIYGTGSGGAAYWGISRLHFDVSELIGHSTTDWGNIGLFVDEYVGYMGLPVHINNPSKEIMDASYAPDCQISDKECETLIKEWESRQVKIEWIRMSDYLMNHSFEDL